MSEYILDVDFPLSEKQYRLLENSGIDYTIDSDGLVFYSEEDRESVSKLLNNK